MITLDNFENFVPYKIWMRGEEYYETDAVSELEEISPGEWTATVEGTDDYNVEISMDGNEIESWYCDCPYDGEYSIIDITDGVYFLEGIEGGFDAMYLEAV